MSRCLTPAICVLALMLSVSARADVNDKVRMMQGPKDSKEFAMKAAEGNMLEIQLAKLAQQKSQSQEIKRFAQMIEQDHTQAGQELMAAAKQKNIDIPADLKGESAEKLQAFQKLEGKDFDNSFVLENVKHHLHDVMMFQNEAQSGTDPDIKAWAAKTLPNLQKHTAHLRTVAQGTGLPVDALAGGTSGGGDTARPAGSRIEGSGTGTGGSGRTGSGTGGTSGGGTGTGTGGSGAGGSGTGTNSGGTGTTGGNR